jgi:hypothetical protein
VLLTIVGSLPPRSIYFFKKLCPGGAWRLPISGASLVRLTLDSSLPIPKRQPTRPDLQRPRQSFHRIHRWQLPPLLNVPDGRVTHPRELPEPDKAKTCRLPGLKQTSPESRTSHRC